VDSPGLELCGNDTVEESMQLCKLTFDDIYLRAGFCSELAVILVYSMYWVTHFDAQNLPFMFHKYFTPDSW